MNQSIVSSGRTVKEAVRAGLDLLDASKEDVNIEILMVEKRGFLGLGKKKAIVKLTRQGISSSTLGDEKNVMASEAAIPTIESLLENLDIEEPAEMVTRGEGVRGVENPLSGKSWVKNGEIHCQPSAEKYPSVSLGKGIKLYKDNVLVQQSSIVLSGHEKLRVELQHEQTETKWKVSVEEGWLKAVLKVEPGYILTRTLDDAEPSDDLKLTVSEQRQTKNSLAYEEVMNKLRNLRITYGIDQGEVIRALNTTEPGEYVIAMGKEPLTGENGWIEYKVDFELKEGPGSRQDGSINFRELKNIPNCSNGQVIAIIHAPKPGKPGVKITNEPIPPQQVMPILLRDCKGIMSIENGNELHVVATESGRPFIQKRGQRVKIAIMPKMVCKGNVDLEYGNIRFHGDVEIMGEVNEKMEVEAKGYVLVHKSVYKASINTTGTILVKGNVIGSEISAGKSNLLIAEMGYSLVVINQQMKSMISVIQELMKSPAFKSSDFARKGLQPLIFILLERKFKNLIPLIKKYNSNLEKNEKHLEYEWKETAMILKECFLSINNELLRLERLQYLAKKMDDLIEISQTPVEPDSYITIPNAMNSSVYCSGNITITGQGCHNTKVHSGGFLQIKGVVRGGEVYGRLGAEINETGSESGVNTLVSVPVNQRIVIHEAKEGTILRIGNYKHIMTKDFSNVNARVMDDQLILT